MYHTADLTSGAHTGLGILLGVGLVIIIHVVQRYLQYRRTHRAPRPIRPWQRCHGLRVRPDGGFRIIVNPGEPLWGRFNHVTDLDIRMGIIDGIPCVLVGVGQFRDPLTWTPRDAWVGPVEGTQREDLPVIHVGSFPKQVRTACSYLYAAHYPAELDAPEGLLAQIPRDPVPEALRPSDAIKDFSQNTRVRLWDIFEIANDLPPEAVDWVRRGLLTSRSRKEHQELLEASDPRDVSDPPSYWEHLDDG